MICKWSLLILRPKKRGAIGVLDCRNFGFKKMKSLTPSYLKSVANILQVFACLLDIIELSYLDRKLIRPFHFHVGFIPSEDLINTLVVAMIWPCLSHKIRSRVSGTKKTNHKQFKSSNTILIEIVI